jgi:hypothetical protein
MTRMTRITSCRRLRAQLLDQPGLTDPGFPADADRGPGGRFEDGVQRTAQLPHLVAASDERPVFRIGRAQSPHAPYTRWFVESFDREVTEVLGLCQLR